ncbi:MAG TPA: NmrA family NAD(P)-binding protein [bacterium]
MILVTGAAGKTGLAVIRALAGLGQPVRALVYREEHIERVQSAGADEWIVGDMRSSLILPRAVQGVRLIYHICPNVSPDEAVIGQRIIAAARAAQVERFVFHSVLHPQVEAMPHHWNKMHVETMLFESGLAFTILQPSSYMQNILVQWRSIVADGIYEIPYAARTRLGMVDLEDVAAVAAAVLTEGDHAGATYELAGPEVLSQTDVAGILARRLERPVRLVEISRDTWAERAAGSGLGPYQIDALLKMFTYYERYGFSANPRILTHLLGREPTTFEMFVHHTPRRSRRDAT